MRRYCHSFSKLAARQSLTWSSLRSVAVAIQEQSCVQQRIYILLTTPLSNLTNRRPHTHQIVNMVKYDDIAKAPTDLLSDDYTSKVTLKCKKLAGDKTVTIETERASNGALSSKVGTKFSIGGFAVDKIQLKPKGDYALETSTSPMSGLKLTFKGGSGADVGVEYTTGSVFATGVLDAKDMSKITTSLCMGVGYGANVGGTLAYSTGKSVGISSYSVGGNYSSGPLFASLTTSKGQANLGLLYSVNSGLSLASTSVHSADSPLGDFTVGCAYKASIGDVKAKVGSDGVVSACVSKSVAPKVSVTVSGSVAGTDFSTFKYGLGVTM